MSNHETTNTNNPIDFNHRINSNFYESMFDLIKRAGAMADALECAAQCDGGRALNDDSLRCAAQAIRLEMGDAESMLKAWQSGRFE